MASITQSFARWPLEQLRGFVLAAVFLFLNGATAVAQSARADGLDVRAIRTEQGVVLAGSTRFDLSPSIEEALLKGVPVHFVYEADLMRERWYWTDRRVSSRSRYLRLSHQLLTRKWRLSSSTEAVGSSSPQANIQQTYDSLAEALAAIKRISRWRIAESQDLEPDAPYTVVVRFRLDLTQLPRPLQIGLTGQSDWSINQVRTVSLTEERSP